MRSLEEELSALEAALGEAQKAGNALTSGLRRLRSGAEKGQIADIEKGLPLVRQRAEEALASVRTLADAWNFDASSYLADGGYIEELNAAAAERGLRLFEKDGRIYCFPLMLRLDSRDVGVRIGKKLERRIRPRALADILTAMQSRPQRFSAERFLDLLYRCYQRIAGPEWRRLDRGYGPVVPVADLHEVLTLLPGTDYPLPEFGRDLLLLARQPDLRTRDGCRFDLPASTVSKGGMRRVTVYDEHGQDHLFVGIRFVRE